MESPGSGGKAAALGNLRKNGDVIDSIHYSILWNNNFTGKGIIPNAMKHYFAGY
jgi:hypothetical protein